MNETAIGQLKQATSTKCAHIDVRQLNSAARLDAAGSCSDAATASFVTAQMAAFDAWVGAVQRMR